MSVFIFNISRCLKKLHIHLFSLYRLDVHSVSEYGIHNEGNW